MNGQEYAREQTDQAFPSATSTWSQIGLPLGQLRARLAAAFEAGQREGAKEFNDYVDTALKGNTVEIRGVKIAKCYTFGSTDAELEIKRELVAAQNRNAELSRENERLLQQKSPAPDFAKIHNDFAQMLDTAFGAFKDLLEPRPLVEGDLPTRERLAMILSIMAYTEAGPRRNRLVDEAFKLAGVELPVLAEEKTSIHLAAVRAAFTVLVEQLSRDTPTIKALETFEKSVGL